MNGYLNGEKPTRHIKFHEIAAEYAYGSWGRHFNCGIDDAIKEMGDDKLTQALMILLVREMREVRQAVQDLADAHGLDMPKEPRAARKRQRARWRAEYDAAEKAWKEKVGDLDADSEKALRPFFRYLRLTNKVDFNATEKELRQARQNGKVGVGRAIAEAVRLGLRKPEGGEA